MAQVALFKCAVRTPTKTYEFEAEVHRSECPQVQVINPEFYIEYVGKTHEGVHHELLLTKSPAFGRVNPEVPIHVYKHPVTGKHFMCWIYQIERLETARDMFEWWCVGTVYTLEQNEDFANICSKAGCQTTVGFIRYMAFNYCIEIVR